MTRKSFSGILELKSLGAYQQIGIIMLEIKCALCTSNLNVSIQYNTVYKQYKFYCPMHLKHLDQSLNLEYDVKKLDRIWLESPFENGVEATVTIT